MSVLERKELSTTVLCVYVDADEEEEEDESVIFRNVQSEIVCVCVTPEERKVDSSSATGKSQNMEFCKCIVESTEEDEVTTKSG